MIDRNRTALPSVALCIVLVAGCATSAPSTRIPEATRTLTAIESATEESGNAPSARQYAAARADFLFTMREIAAEYGQAARSPARRVRNAIGVAGAIVGLGATGAALVVDDADTQTAIAAAGAGFAGISGIVSLLPFGEPPPGAEAVPVYLLLELDRFEASWPAELADAPSEARWSAFAQDARHVAGIAAQLAR